MGRDIRLHPGLNGEFSARRWEKPESWIDITSDLGYAGYEFCTDLIDPFFCGDSQFQLEQARKVRKAAGDNGIQIPTVRSGTAAERFWGLSHSHPLPRQRMVEWIVGMMDIAREMGVECIGGHWDSISTEVRQNQQDCREVIARKRQRVQELSQIAADRGLKALYYEQMYDPAHTPYTIKQSEEFVIETNRDNDGCAIYPAVNVGHAAGRHHGLAGRDVSYIEWLKALAAFTPIIHLQQTTADACRYAPLTERSAELGHIDMEKVIEAIEYSHAHFKESWISEVLRPVSECWLIVHVIPDLTVSDDRLLSALKETAEYIQQWLPEGQLTIEV